MNINEIKDAAEDVRTLINAKRASLAKRLTDGNDMRNQINACDLADYLNTIAKLEGEERVWLRIRYMLESKPDIERAQVEMVLTSMLLEGADDRWSGRTNDIRRARFEGTRDAVSAFIKFM